MFNKLALRNPKAYLIIGAFLSFLIAGMLFAPKAEAANYYPSDASDHYAISAYSGHWDGRYNCANGAQHGSACATGLTNANQTRYKLFRYDKPSITTYVYIENGCRNVPPATSYTKPSRPDKGLRNISVEVHNTVSGAGGAGPQYGPDINNFQSGNQPNAANCVGNDLRVPVNPNAFDNQSQSSRYGTGVYTALIIINKYQIHDPGEKWFRVSYPAPGGQVFGDDDGYFALGSNKNQGNASTYRFTFRVDCRYKGETVKMKIGDLDYDDLEVQGDDNPYVTVREQGGGQVRDETTGAYEDGYYTLGAGKLTVGHTYTVEVGRIDNSNGIPFGLPFSEFQGYGQAQCPPKRAATCSIKIYGNVNAGDSQGVQAGQKFRVDLTINNVGTDPLPYVNESGHWLSAIIKPPFGWDVWDPYNNQGNGPPDGVKSNTTAGAAPFRFLPPNSSEWAVPSHQSRTRTIYFTSPNDQGNRQLAFYPGYWSEAAKLSQNQNPVDCVTQVHSYQRFNFDATATTQLDSLESPGKVTFKTSIREGTGHVVDFQTASSRGFYKRSSAGVNTGFNCPTQSIRDPANPAANKLFIPPGRSSIDYTDECGIPAGSYDLGDRWCVLIIFPYSQGWHNGSVGVNKTFNEGPLSATSCPDRDSSSSPSVTDKPYVKTYGADVAVGGGIKDVTGSGVACGDKGPQNRTSHIIAFTRPLSTQIPGTSGPGGSDNQGGSGSQLGAMAIDTILGFTSAGIRSSQPNPPKGLTFGNDDPSGGVLSNSSILNMSDTPYVGGFTQTGDGNGWCIPDFYGSKQFTETSNVTDRGTQSQLVTTAANDLNTLPSGKQTKIKAPSGNKVTVGGNGATLLGSSVKHTVFVDGDLYINRDIKYVPGYGSLNSIPSFTVVVKGNIYIDRNVNRLDGLYIAQPKSNNDRKSGWIYTCSDASGAVTNESEMFTKCWADTDRKLEINGTFIAQRVVLNRVSNSIRDSRFAEKASGPNSTKAAEVFNFSPEIYLSPPIFRNDQSEGGGTHYMSILAPIL